MKLVYFITLFAILLVGCKGTKDYYKNTGQLKNITDAKLLKSTQDNYTDYKHFFYKKFHAEIELDGEKKSFKGNLYIDRDSAIIVSINTLMNIEVLRVRFSPDKVEIIDRTKRVYIKNSYKLLWDKFMIELDYSLLQSILLNELYYYPLGSDSKLDLKKYKHDLKDNVYTFQSLKKGRYSRIYNREATKNIVLHEFHILPEVFKVSKSFIKDFNSNSTLEISYTDFESVNSQLIANSVAIKGERNGQRFSLDVKFPNIDVSGSQSIGFKVSNKYEVRDLINE